MTNLRAAVFQILGRELNAPLGNLSGSVRLREDLGMDSILALNIIFAAERELGVVIREEDIVDITTIADLEALIARQNP
jgi:acyl carrier protein